MNELSQEGTIAGGLRTKPRMLVIVNPHATTVSARLENLVVYALQSRFRVEVAPTERPSHATEIGREACEGGFDIVLAFGGDGTLNEVANGVAGTGIPVAILPGGATNVVCRMLGIPDNVIDATEFLLARADELPQLELDMGLIEGRHFVFSAGFGVDASTVRLVDSRPRVKAALGPYFYTWSALRSYYSDYLLNPISLQVEAEGESHSGVTALVQNGDPFTYFGSRPVRVCPDVRYDDGRLGVAVLERARQRDVAGLIPRLLTGSNGACGHRRVRHIPSIAEALVSTRSTDAEGSLRPVPCQVDGDYIGHRTEAHIRVAPGALRIVA